MAVSNSIPPMNASSRWAERRTQAVAEALGDSDLHRIQAFSWHLQGVETSAIAEAVGTPVDTLNGLFKRVLRDGASALQDRRCTRTSPPPEPLSTPSSGMRLEADTITVSIGTFSLRLDRSDALLCRIVLFFLLESGWLNSDMVADALALSAERIRKLRSAFRRDGTAALIDRRQGQVKEYSMTPETKAELICQYVNHLQTNQSLTAPALKAAVEDAGKPCPSPETVRVHVAKLGLPHIHADEELPASVKKGLCTR